MLTALFHVLEFFDTDLFNIYGKTKCEKHEDGKKNGRDCTGLTSLTCACRLRVMTCLVVAIIKLQQHIAEDRHEWYERLYLVIHGVITLCDARQLLLARPRVILRRSVCVRWRWDASVNTHEHMDCKHCLYSGLVWYSCHSVSWTVNAGLKLHCCVYTHSPAV